MNKTMKWTSAVLAAGVLLGGSGLVGGTSVNAATTGGNTVKQAAQQPSIALKYKGQTLTQQGKIVDGNTMIPLTVLRDAFGLAINYNSTTKTYSVGSDSMKLNLEISDYGVSTDLNGYYIYSATGSYEAKMINNRLYVPFKLLNDYLGIQGVYNPVQKSLELSKLVMNDIKITSVTLDKSNKNATIQIQYPKISGLTDEVQNTLNANFKKEAELFASEAEKEASRRDGTIENKYDYSQTYVVTFNREGVLSVVVDQYGYSGGAHGGTFRTGHTFSLKDGKKIELKDLLKAEPNYKQKLDKMLKASSKDIAFPESTGGLTEKPDFYVSESGLAIFYQQYEIAPYAAGIPTYTFNFSSILPKGTNPFASFK
jgi:curved DNA-binding protein CbpA